MSNTTKLSEHFTLSEMQRSAYATRKELDNTAPDDVKVNLQALCKNVLEPLRDLLNTESENEIGISVLSGYRSPAVNKGVGGAKNSQHLTGNACDFYVRDMTVEELFDFILNSNLEYDQVIQEFDSWVHISWAGDKNRKQALRAKKVNGKTQYIHA